MTSRRRLLQAGAVGLVAAGRSYSAPRSKSFHYSDIEKKIRRGDYTGLTKEHLPTPCLILQEEAFERNIRHMADYTKTAGIEVRPHVKIHKSPMVSKKQIALGAIGVCCATIAESELLSASGVRNVLYTCQPAGLHTISRVADLSKRDPSFLAVADDPITVGLLDEACGAVGAKLNVLVDNYVGLTRQGCQPGKPAFAIAQKIDAAKHLTFRGVMGYSGDASHTKGFENRKQRSANDLAGLRESAELCKRSGLPVDFVTGGSTGTYNIDKDNGLTELQAGSFVFMDTSYMKIGGKDDDKVYNDFVPSLTVMTTVVSHTRKNEAAIDAGNKAMLRVSDQVVGRPDVEIKNQGAEYGILVWQSGPEIKLGDRVEIYPTNLDTSTNVYDRYYVARGEQIVDVWPIMGRAGSPQR